MHLIPAVSSLQPHEGTLFSGVLTTLQLPTPIPESLSIAAGLLANEMQALTTLRPRIVPGDSPVVGAIIKISISSALAGAQHYTLDISSNGISLVASDEAGAFYGIQTLRQMLRSEGPELPCVFIDDKPDMLYRGFYHDVTRSKVPTLATLKKLADKLAYYKINQLQLYVEHTFAFARHADICSCVDPLTAEEILELDRYCQARHIELVPSMSTFGHMYMTLCSKRNEDLNELDVKGSEKPFSYHDRMAHYTLNCSNPDSIKLVREMLEEYIPLFRSKFFNICCDETFDLGKGRNKDKVHNPQDAGKLYIGFLKKIIGILSEHGKTPMFWGDVIHETPELMKELPAGTIALDWDYGPNADWHETGNFQKANVPFYVCPGTSSWNRTIPDVNVATDNIINLALKGEKFGTLGLLNTDWGDFGHVSLLATSYHGLALGAAAGWNTHACMNQDAFDLDFSVIELGLPNSDFLKLWRQFCKASVLIWHSLSMLVDDSTDLHEKISDEQKRIYDQGLPKACEQLAELFPKIAVSLAKSNPLDPEANAECLIGFRGSVIIHQAMQNLYMHTGRHPWDVADALRAYEHDLLELWLKRNKLGEYGYFRAQIRRLTAALDAEGKNIQR